MGFEFAGLNEYRDAFQRLRARGRETMDGALKEHMERTVKPMADELVPKLTGALMETGRVVHGDKELSYSLKYGNSPVNDRSMVDYAAAVHEREDTKHAPPTEFKYVYKPLHETKDKIGETVGKKLDTLIQEG